MAAGKRRDAQLLLAALADEPPVDVSLPVLRPEQEQSLWHAAWHHRVVTGMARFVTERQASSSFVAGLRLARREQQLRDMQTDADLRLLARALDGEGVRWLAFKGLVLARTVYRRPDLRMYTDLDVLVHPRDLERAVRVLHAHGARHVGASWRKLDAARIAQVGQLLRHGTLLDLHWNPLSLPWAREAFPMDVPAMLRRSTRRDVGGFDVPIMAAEDTLVHLAVHGCLSGAYRLLWLKDLDQAARVSMLEWPLVRARADEWKAALPLVVMLRRTHAAFGTPVPDRVLIPPPSGRTWVALLQAVNRASPVERHLSPHHTGQSLWHSTRRTSLTSAKALLAEVRRLDDEVAGPVTSVAQLSLGNHDETDFTRYLGEINSGPRSA